MPILVYYTPIWNSYSLNIVSMYAHHGGIWEPYAEEVAYGIEEGAYGIEEGAYRITGGGIRKNSMD